MNKAKASKTPPTKKTRKWKGWPGVTPEEFNELVAIEKRVLSGEEPTVSLDDVMAPTIRAVARKLK